MINNVVLVGRLTKEPELRYIPSGSAVTNFTLAVDKGLSREKKAEFESKGQPTADFINVVVWGKPAENAAQYLAKGRLTGVQGSIQTRSWEAQDGTRKYATEVLANNVQFLEWGDKKENSSNSQDFSEVSNDDIPF